MEREFIKYTEALELKKLGYIENIENGLKNYGMYCEGVFYRLYPNMGNDIPDNVYREVDAPLYQQAFRWFREKYSYQSFICPSNELTYLAYDFTLKGFDGYFKSKQFKTYEEAELDCLKKLIEIVESKKE